MRNHLSDFFLRRVALAWAVLAGLLLFMGAPQLRAGGDDCQRNVAKVDHKLHEAIEHHGYFSKQADHWRHELAEARVQCWSSHHRWWDEDAHRWHTDHDWDDHDHDQDHH